MKCHRGCGCTAQEIVQAVGLELTDLFPPNPSNGRSKRQVVAEYVYRDADGAPALKVLRYEPKDFRQQCWDGQNWSWQGAKPKLLYRLLELLAKPARAVFVVEGERDVDRLVGLDLLATCNPGGAGKWRDEYSETLAAHPLVFLLPDNDTAGKRYVLQKADSLLKHGCAARVVELPGVPEHGDVSHWLNSGHSVEELKELTRQADPLTAQTLTELRERWDVDSGPVAEVVEEPRPITRELPPAESFPMDALGDVLGGAAQVMSEVIQAPPAMCGQSVLAAAALAVQGHANLTIDGRESPVSEFFITTGVTGERKTAADNAALSPIREFQQTITEQYEMDFAEYKRDSKAFEKATKDALGGKTGGGYDAKKRALDELGEGPVEPVKPFLTCDDPTYEGLVKLLAVGRPSFGIFSDEGGRFIGGHGMKQENQLKTAAGLSHLWDGRAISRVRAGDGASLLPGRRVSFHMMAQPEVAQLMLSNTLLLEQGLLSRCLVTWPESTVGSRFYKEMDLSASPEIRQYSARLLEVLETPLPLAEGKQNELDPRRLPLAGDAKRAWIAFHDAVERNLRKGGTLDAIKGLGNKAPEHAARLAAVLALVDDLQVSSISLEWMEAGIALMTHYLNEALRLFSAGAVSPELTRAQRLLAWLQERRKQEVTLVEVYRFGPNEIRDAGTARGAMAILVNHGWAIRLENGADFEGARRKDAWRIRK